MTGTCTRCPSGAHRCGHPVSSRHVLLVLQLLESIFLYDYFWKLFSPSRLWFSQNSISSLLSELEESCLGQSHARAGRPRGGCRRSSRLRSARACACPRPDPTLRTHFWRALPGRPPASCSQSSALWHCVLCRAGSPGQTTSRVWARPRPLRHRTPCQSSSERGLLTCRLISEVEQARREASVPFKAPGSARYFWFQRISKTRAVGKNNRQMLQLVGNVFKPQSLY